jgi:hypothetical protein
MLFEWVAAVEIQHKRLLLIGLFVVKRERGKPVEG